MRMNRLCLMFLLAGLTALLAGCAAVLVGAGAGTAVYVTGDLKGAIAENITVSYEAALKAAEQLELTVSSKVKDALSAKIVARDAQDKKVSIYLTAASDNSTKVAVKVGFFGNETKSRLIYDQIQKNIKK